MCSVQTVSRDCVLPNVYKHNPQTQRTVGGPKPHWQSNNCYITAEVIMTHCVVRCQQSL